MHVQYENEGEGQYQILGMLISLVKLWKVVDHVDSWGGGVLYLANWYIHV